MVAGRGWGGVAREVKGTVKDRVSSLLVLASLLLVVIPVSGCATGAPFVAVTEIPAGKALVYIYRPRALLGGGPEYDVAVGEERIATLAAGGYYPYFARPGRADFWGHTKAITVLTAELKAGGVYYLRGGIQSDVGTKRPSFELVSEGAARGELVKCRLAEALGD